MSSQYTNQTEAHFNTVADCLFGELQAGEGLNLSLDGEESNFFRFNGSQVRQNTFVQQNLLTLRFQKEKRRISFDWMLTGNLEQDQKNTLALLQRAREEVRVLPEDPFLPVLENHGESHQHFSGKMLPPDQCMDSVLSAASGVDFAGLYAGGSVIRASRNSLGQKHWFSTENFFMDYSLYTKNADGDNKAVKGVYAGNIWDQHQFQNKLQTSKNQLGLMRRKTVAIPRGRHRAYLAPAALAEVVGTMSWGAFSMAAFKQGHCGLAKMHEGKFLSPLFSIRENFELGLCPQFNSLGELAPTHLPLIERGQSQNLLVSSRSAKEYGVASNGASPESLRSTEVLPGKLNETDHLKELGTGLYLGNLHYLNWSDVSNGRITGMTRYACFWVEKGEVVGPIQDLRFDDSLFSLLGTHLEAVTDRQEIEPEIGTYIQRSLGGKKLPGLLVSEMSFTL